MNTSEIRQLASYYGDLEISEREPQELRDEADCCRTITSLSALMARVERTSGDSRPVKSIELKDYTSKGGFDPHPLNLGLNILIYLIIRLLGDLPIWFLRNRLPNVAPVEVSF
ncbi:MAG: hypothetical protein ABEJ03_01825 [Candidatus Nanohaloarchaea archaeon]